MIDLSGAQAVEIRISEDRTRVWVNVDGVCQLRVQRIKGVFLDDDSGRVVDLAVLSEDARRTLLARLAEPS